jgi:hypothetical protein
VMKKKLSMIVGILGTLAFLAAPPSWAQQSASPQAPPAVSGKHAFGKRAWKYNPQAVETLTGKVVAVTRHTSKRPGRPARVAMMLQTEKGKVKVSLGPADYLDQQGLKLAAGDQVEVKGVQVTHHNRTSFIAGEVKKGGQVLKLRDEATGRPLWATGRRPRGA